MVYVYVMNPAHSYDFPESTRHSEVGARPSAKPKESVFVVYAEMKDVAYEALIDLPEELRGEIVGTINYWEWVMDSPADLTLPENFETRYHERVW